MYNHPLILSESPGMTKPPSETSSGFGPFGPSYGPSTPTQSTSTPPTHPINIPPQALFQFLPPAAAVTGKILGALGTVAGAAWLYKKLAEILIGKTNINRLIDKYNERVYARVSTKALANAPKPENFTQGYLPGVTSGRGFTEAEKRMIDKYKALANASKPGNFTQGYLPGVTSGRGFTEAEKRMIDKYKALANASKPGNFTQGYLPGFTSADPYKFPYRIAPFSSRFPRNVPPYVAEARLPRRVHAIVNQLGEMSKAKLPKGKGIGFWGPFSGALMAWFLRPHIKEFAYGIGLGQPITAAQQRLSGKPIDWGTLRDPAVEHYFDTQYRMINPQF